MYAGKHKKYCKELQNYWKCFKDCLRAWNIKNDGVSLVKKMQRKISKWFGVGWYNKKIHKAKNYSLQNYSPNLIGNYLFRGKYAFRFKKDKFMLGISLSDRTVHRLLLKRGKIPKRKNYRRPLFQNGHAMRPVNTKELGFLQMDTKHVTPELSGLATTVYEYAAIDIFSRFKLAVILPDISDESATLALHYFLKWFPFNIKYIQTDNGLEFQRTFHEFCLKKGVNHYFIHKNSPNENAVIERSFRTDQDEFYFWLEKAPIHIGELNTWLQEFIQKYNYIRPHQSLNYLTPNQIVSLNLKAVKV